MELFNTSRSDCPELGDFAQPCADASAHTPATIWIHVKHAGSFITFEGMDGSGKTTQMHRLAARLRAMGRTVIETVEPGGPPIAHEDPAHSAGFGQSGTEPDAPNCCSTSPRARRTWTKWIRPALERGEIVLSDRFTDSSLVYQGFGRGLGADAVVGLDRIACRGLKPDLTILVDVDAEASLARARARNQAEPHCETRMDDQSLEFHRKVYDAYHALAAAEPERVKLVNGRADIDEIERGSLGAS